jgi:TRAP-type uncharacterized transport system substrate-binding protein
MNKCHAALRKARERWRRFAEPVIDELRGWVAVVMHFRWLVLATVGGVVFVAAVLRPWPPAKAYLATGQAGSSYTRLAEQFAAIFARHGIELVLRPTAGLEEGWVRLQDDADPVNASFLTGGGKAPDTYTSLMSMGSVQFSPLWIFYRGETNAFNSFVELRDMRLAIGLPGSATRNIFAKLAGAHGIAYKARPNFHEVSRAAAIDRLRRGELDAVFMVDGIDSPNVQALLNMPGVHMLNLTLAEAYLKHLPELSQVRIPKGSLDITRVVPPQDVVLLSSTVNLLVQDDMHPALQWLFLLAAREVGQGRNQFFAKPGDFPADLDQTVSLSPIARRYFDHGIPSVFAHLPLHWAALFDRIWLLTLWCFAVAIPAWVGAQSLRQTLASNMVDGLRRQLLWIDRHLDALGPANATPDVIERLHRLRAQADAAWFPNASDHMSLLQDIRSLQSRLTSHAPGTTQPDPLPSQPSAQHTPIVLKESV